MMKYLMPPIRQNQQSGMSLIAVLMALALTGIFYAIVSRIGENALRAAKNISIANEKEDLRNYIRVRTSCFDTKARIVSGQPILLYDRLLNPISPASGGIHRLNEWQFKVESYAAASSTFVILAYHPAELDQSTPFKPLFKSVPFTCP